MSRKKSALPEPNPIVRALPWLIGGAAVVAGTIYLFRSGPKSTAASESVGPFGPTIANTAPAPGAAPEGMVWIPGGEFSMGSADPTTCGCEGAGFNPMNDARPIHRVYVDGFFMDATEVTNEQFAKFADATGYITIAERKPRAEDFPGVPEENLIAGSTIFTPTAAPVPLDSVYRWWRYQPGANWRHPDGPSSDWKTQPKHPAVHIAYEDAEAYCKWAGKRMPTEAEWEFAARGGKVGQRFSWGDTLRIDGKYMANTYQGQFPVKDIGSDGYASLAPVAQFPANPYGLYDMAGNVREWCSDWYRADTYQRDAANGLVRNPQGPADSLDPAEPGAPKRIHRGGSFLCHESYCARYLLGTRDNGEVSTGSNHCGFRTVMTAQQYQQRKTAAR